MLSGNTFIGESYMKRPSTETTDSFDFLVARHTLVSQIYSGEMP